MKELLIWILSYILITSLFYWAITKSGKDFYNKLRDKIDNIIPYMSEKNFKWGVRRSDDEYHKFWMLILWLAFTVLFLFGLFSSSIRGSVLGI